MSSSEEGEVLWFHTESCISKTYIPIPWFIFITKLVMRTANGKHESIFMVRKKQTLFIPLAFMLVSWMAYSHSGIST